MLSSNAQAYLFPDGNSNYAISIITYNSKNKIKDMSHISLGLVGCYGLRKPTTRTTRTTRTHAPHEGRNVANKQKQKMQVLLSC